MTQSPEEFTVSDSDVAVVGMSVRFPGAKTIGQFWENLTGGVESVRFFSDDELAQAGVDPALLADANYVKAQPYLEDIDKFDARFFGYSPAEARLIDPQQRMFLECAWEAMEDAGYDGLTFPGQVGVYGGSTVNTYMLQGQPVPDLTGDFLSILTGCDKDFLATRVSYKLNLQGPSVTLQTACSTGLVAVHMAAQALLGGECDMALAGAVSIWSLEKSGYLHQPGGIVSPDGHCRAFDARAEGTLFGNGAGLVVLRRLEDALADGDHIYAVLKGSAVNNDGGLKIGFSATSVEGQARVIGEALAMADVAPETISYVETHGTGTPLGDPVEFEGLCRAFRAATDKKGFCAIGSVKTNIGHMGAASGIAGFIKAVLAIQRGVLPPSLHFHEPNPQIDFADSPFYVAAELADWQSADGPRRAGVTSLGIGGTNAHVVLQQPPLPAPGGADDRSQLIVLSAKTETALEDSTDRLANYFQNGDSQAPLADVAYTLRAGRRPLDYRRIAVCRDAADAGQALLSRDATRVFTAQTPSQPASVAFVFPSHAAGPPCVDRELYQQQPIFRDAIDRCCNLLKSELDVDLRPFVCPPGGDGTAARQIVEPGCLEAALFVAQWALAKQWQHWGIRPAAMFGHGVGELVAACLAEVFSLEDAARLVALRGQWINESPAGAAVSIAAPAEKIAGLLGEQLSLMADNGPGEALVVGPDAAVAQLETELDRRGVPWRRRHGAFVADTAMGDNGHDEPPARLSDLQLAPPRIPFVSGVTGDWITDQQATDPDYWAAHVCQAVRFAAGLETLAGQQGRLWIKVGRGDVAIFGENGDAAGEHDADFLPSLAAEGDEASDSETMLTSLGRLWLAGLPVDWSALDDGHGRRRVSLPTYPFRRDRYWYDELPRGSRDASAKSRQNIAGVSGSQPPVGLPLVGRRLRSPLRQSMYESRFSIAEIPLLKEHMFYGAAVAPAVAYLQMALTAAEDAQAGRVVAVQDAFVQEALVLQAEETRIVQTILRRDDASPQATVEIHSAAEGESGDPSAWKLHASAKLSLAPAGAADELQTPSKNPALDEIRGACDQQVSGEEYYRSFTAHGVELGPGFQVIDHVWLRPEEAVCRLRAVSRPALQTGSLAVDAGFQLFSAVCSRSAGAEDDATYVPWAFDSIHYYQAAERTHWVHVRLDGSTDPKREVIRGKVLLVDDSQQPVAEIEGLRFKRLSRENLPRPAGAAQRQLLYQIQWKPAPPETSSENPARLSPGDWLILLDAGGIGAALSSRLAEAGHTCTLVKPGDCFAQSADGPLRIDPRDAQQYRRLIESWQRAGSARRGIIHLWNLDAGGLTPADDQPLGPRSTLGCQSLFYLLQAMAASAEGAHGKVSVVTQGACRTGGDDEVVSPPQALCWGLGRTAALEHAALWGGLIDLDAEEPIEAARALLNEVLNADGESQVALRGRRRLVPRLIANPAPDSEPSRPAIRPDSTYLITGGMGALGRRTAQWLIDLGARHLVLCGRGGPSAEAIRWAEYCENEGIDVSFTKADVASAADVKRLMANIEHSGHPLRGIVHAAGVLDDGILVRQDWGRFIEVLPPKAQGAWLLHQATRGKPLDFFILYSSIAAAFGSPAQGNYAAANAFLDALAHYRRSTGDTALSINWGPWDEAGMAAEGDRSRARRPLRGLRALSPDTALAMLQRALSADTAQAVIVDADWHELVRQFDPATPPALLTTITSETARQAPQRPAGPAVEFASRWQSAPPAGRRDLLVLHVKEQIAALLGMEMDELAETDQSLDDIGLDSLAGIQLRDNLSKALDCPLPATLIFDCPTIDAMAEFLYAQLLGPEESDTTDTASTNHAPRREHAPAELDELTEDQLAALLDDKLAAIDELTAD